MNYLKNSTYSETITPVERERESNSTRLNNQNCHPVYVTIVFVAQLFSTVIPNGREESIYLNNKISHFAKACLPARQASFEMTFVFILGFAYQSICVDRLCASVTNAAATLTDSSAILTNASAILTNGSAILQRGIATLQNGNVNLQKGIATLQRGIATLQRGIATLQRGFANLQRGSAGLIRKHKVFKINILLTF